MYFPELRQSSALAFTFLLHLTKIVQFLKVVDFAATCQVTLFLTDGNSPSIQIEFKTIPLLKSKISARLYLGPERPTFASQEI